MYLQIYFIPEKKSKLVRKSNKNPRAARLFKMKMKVVAILIVMCICMGKSTKNCYLFTASLAIGSLIRIQMKTFTHELAHGT